MAEDRRRGTGGVRPYGAGPRRGAFGAAALVGERPVEQVPEAPVAGDVSAAVAERSRLEVALARLPAKQRAAVVLRYYQDLSERQVAEVLGCPLGTARSHAARGVARLRELLADVIEPVG
ncbi:hypothetical protein GCM10020256_68830 [Streptomyces thermocoprophilus]